MFMLRDARGRAVVFKDITRRSAATGERSEEKVFLAKCGDEMEAVPEAVVEEGDDVFLNEAYVRRVLEAEGFDLAFLVQKHSYGGFSVQVAMSTKWGGMVGRGSNTVHTIEGKEVTQERYERLDKLLEEMNACDRLVASWGVALKGGATLSFQHALEMLGPGAVVTPESLCRGTAKGEDRPRLLPGDTVSVDLRGGPVAGRVSKLGSKVSVLTKDGRKATYPYSKVRRDESAVAYDEGVIAGLDPSIAEYLDWVRKTAGDRYYKAATEKARAVFPAFPDEDKHERQVTLEDAPTCKCPVCGWTMADFENSGEFVCSFCRIRGMVVRQEGAEVVLLIYRMPAKNRFASKEARCCANCGLFEFETGRQGRRTTGHCRYSNQCLQAYNVCEYWFPRSPDRFASNMKQNVTNLGYGVSDRRNTGRNDIRDTVYREEDHELERQRAEKAKVSYAQAYEKLMADLAAASAAAPEVGDAEEWKRRLDDGC